MKKYIDFLLERLIDTDHFKERVEERLNIDNVKLYIKGVEKDKLEVLKKYFTDKVKENVRLIKEKYYNEDYIVRAVKIATVNFKKNDEVLVSKISTTSKNKAGNDITRHGNVYYGVTINNKLLTILTYSEKDSEDKIKAGIKDHNKRNNFGENPVQILNNEIDTSVTIFLDENNDVIENTDREDVSNTEFQYGVSIGSNLKHLGFLVDTSKDKLVILKDENNKPKKDYKDAIVKDVVSLKNLPIRKGSKEEVKNGVKILFEDKTQKTFKVGDKVKIDGNDKLLTITKIFLDKRQASPLNFMLK